jgi:DNA-binding MarR family transcriptional regulator
MAAVRLSRLQTRLLRWLVADAQRTRGMITRSPPELVAALPRAKGNLSHRRRCLETQGLIVLTRTPGGKTARVSLTAAGRQKARKLAGRYEEGGTIESNKR